MNEASENHSEQQETEHHEIIHLQKPGMRMLKTTIGVFICLLISFLQSSGELRPFHACFAVIITLKSDLKHTWQAGTNRVFGTAVGAFMGLIAMHIRIIWNLKTPSIIYYLIITLMMFFVIWLTIIIKTPEITAFCAVVFLSTALSQTNDSTLALSVAFYRFLDTTIGILVAYFVNWALPPYNKKAKS